MITGKLLDIGCGSGYFLSIAEKLGFDCYGIDINPKGIEMGKKQFGLKQIYCCSLSEFEKSISSANSTRYYFDIITMFETLEHLDCPARTIRLVHALLKDCGFLVLSTPNRNRLFTPFRKEVDYPPNHQTRWSSKVLTQFLNSQGFQVVKLYRKPLDTRELSRKIIEERGFKMAAKVLDAGARKRNRTFLFLGNVMCQAKRGIIYSVFFPVTLVLRTIGFDGWDLYCVAQKRSLQ